MTPHQAQLIEHSTELLHALSDLTNAPIFDDLEGETLDADTRRALVQANTALLNAQHPYLPFYKDDIAAPV